MYKRQDYDKDSEITHQFYAMIQNKFHYAITGNTAAEIIYIKADVYKRQFISSVRRLYIRYNYR